MRLCGRCRKAENPQGELRFLDSPEGVLCQVCHDKLYRVQKALGERIDPSESLVVITCPSCRGKHHSTHGAPCESCCGYGSVRIPANALPVYRPGKQVITED